MFLIVTACFSYAGPFDDILKGIKLPATTNTGKSGLDDSTIISGLKEALSIGTDNAVLSTSKVDGYFDQNTTTGQNTGCRKYSGKTRLPETGG